MGLEADQGGGLVAADPGGGENRGVRQTEGADAGAPEAERAGGLQGEAGPTAENDRHARAAPRETGLGERAGKRTEAIGEGREDAQVAGRHRSKPSPPDRSKARGAVPGEGGGGGDGSVHAAVVHSLGQAG